MGMQISLITVAMATATVMSSRRGGDFPQNAVTGKSTIILIIIIP
jgi:hypothetical protein